MAKIKIVLVEDEKPIQQMYQYKLELAGYEVQTADDGQAGLLLIEAFQPNLVLLDLKMPVMSGEEMLEKVRASKSIYQPRVVVLTNISKDEAPASLRFLSVDRYIVKAHHTPGQILELVRDLIGPISKPTP